MATFDSTAALALAQQCTTAVGQDASRSAVSLTLSPFPPPSSHPTAAVCRIRDFGEACSVAGAAPCYVDGKLFTRSKPKLLKCCTLYCCVYCVALGCCIILFNYNMTCLHYVVLLCCIFPGGSGSAPVPTPMTPGPVDLADDDADTSFSYVFEPWP